MQAGGYSAMYAQRQSGMGSRQSPVPGDSDITSLQHAMSGDINKLQHGPLSSNYLPQPRLAGALRSSSRGAIRWGSRFPPLLGQ